MSRVLLGAARTAAVLVTVAMLGAGCDTISGAKDTVDTAANTVEVCAEATKLANDAVSSVNTAAQEVASTPNDPAKLEAAKNTVKTKFTEMYEGLQTQIEKAKDADVKTALETLATAVNTWAGKPETYLTEATKFNELTGNVTKACSGS